MAVDQNSRVCEVCRKVKWKYKCATCLVKHCSLDCFQAHKSGCQKSPEKAVVVPNEDEVPLVPIDLGDDCSDYLPTRVLERLKTSDCLKELLSNRHLREYLVSLDSSPRPAKAIERAMKEPLFIEFADECMRLINPEEFPK